MADTLSRVTALLFAVAILLMGHGLQLTLLPVHALSLGWSSTEIGLTGSFYFIGFVTGCMLVPGVVSRVGHVRSFKVMSAGATVALLAAALLVNLWEWMLFRFLTGMALAGIYDAKYGSFARVHERGKDRLRIELVIDAAAEGDLRNRCTEAD